MECRALEARDLLVPVPGGRIFVRVWSDVPLNEGPPPIVLIHDSLGSVDLWRDFPSRLADATGHPIVAYDRLGFGQADPHPGELETPAFVFEEARGSLPALHAALGVERMILFGHSVGGAMAIVGAARMPGAVAAVITESAQVFAEELTLASIRAAREAFEAPGQVERLARYHGDKAGWVLKAWTASWLAPAFATWNVEEDIRRLPCPVLTMHGDRDEYGSREHPRRIAAMAPGRADVVLFDDCGHVPHREHPDQVLRVVAAYTRSLHGGG